MDHVVSIEEIPQQQQTSNYQMEDINAVPKKNLLPWKILCLVLAVLVTLGWVGIIVLLILKEEWQLVLVAWLMLYAAAHFCYWYCRRHSSRTFSTQIREHLARMRGEEVTTSIEGDAPPSYDDLVKSEVPPPAYYTVVDESPRFKRFLQVNSLALPWFIKKKSLEQTVAVNATTGSSEPSTSTGVYHHQEESSTSWKSSGSATVVVCDLPVATLSSMDDDEDSINLPSYDTLMKEAVQPVLTPIHRALASMPSLPPPYSPKPVENNVTQQQQPQNE